MTHAFGAFLLIAALAGFGVMRTQEIKQRPRELRNLIDAMSLLQNDIVSRQLPLPDALAHAGGMSSGAARALFISVKDQLWVSAVSFAYIWNDAVEQLTILHREDREILQSLGSHLGRFDTAAQGNALNHCIASLKLNEKNAREYANQYSRLYTGLGLTLGAMLAVVMY